MEIAYQAPTPAPLKRPLFQRINFRMIFFGAVVLFLLGSPVYIFLSEKLTGGIRNRGDYLEVDLKAMSSFEMDQVQATMNDIPAKWRALDGKRVALEGEIYQPFEAGGQVGGFELVYSIAKCCMSGPPKVQHFVHSKVEKGKKVAVYGGLVRVMGKLHVKLVREEDRVKSIYQLEVESIEPT